MKVTAILPDRNGAFNAVHLKRGNDQWNFVLLFLNVRWIKNIQPVHTAEIQFPRRTSKNGHPIKLVALQSVLNRKFVRIPRSGIETNEPRTRPKPQISEFVAGHTVN